MTLFRWTFALSMVGAVAAAQAPSAQQATSPGEITGVVAEAGLNRGIEGAEVTVYLRAPVVAGQPITNNVVARIQTDSQGAFHFQPSEFGYYMLLPKKEGYTPAGGGNPFRVAGRQIDVQLDAEHPGRAVRFTLGREGQVSGRMLDAESGLAVSGMTVLAQQRYFASGLARLFPGGSRGVTDAEGRFTIKGLNPAEYVISVMPRVTGKDQFMAQFTENDLKTIDQDYPQTYWPGGGGLDSVQPVSITSGLSMDIGAIKLRKAPFYRVRVTLTNNNCEPGSKVSVEIQTVSNEYTTTLGTNDAICGQQFLLRNYQAGFFTLLLQQGKTPNRVRSILPVDIRDKNLDLIAALERGVDIDVRLVTAEGAGPIALDKVQVQPTTHEGTSWADESMPTSGDAQGRFKLLNRAMFGKLQFNLVTGTNPTYYIKEIRYNGVALPTDVIMLNSGSPAQSIELVIDDQPANVSGSVKEGDKVVNQPYVVLAKWPLSNSTHSPPKNVIGGSDGSFTIGKLAPGEYRVFAVAQALRDKLDEPGVMQRVAGRSEKLTVGRGSSQTVTLKLADPSR